MGSGVRRSVIEGVGSYLPARIMSNADLARMVDTSDEWIVERTGIRERRIAAEKETTGDLAINAARDALVQSGTRADEIDLIERRAVGLDGEDRLDLIGAGIGHRPTECAGL